MELNNEQLMDLHSTYCYESKMPLRWDSGRAWWWKCFVAKGFTKEDLVTVMRYLKTRHAQGKPARSLLFRRLIQGPEALDAFEEDLGAAKAERRTPRYAPAKEQVLRATGRSDAVPHGEARTAAQVLHAKELAYLNFKRSMQEEGLA